jgi:putative chitinase
MITKEQLSLIYPFAKARIDIFLPFLNKYAGEYQVNTKLRIAANIAQIGHESCQLRYTEEIASGAAYEGRKDLGNTLPGDGVKFKGRGLIQITGRSNYTLLSKDFGIDFINNPALLSSPEWAVRSAFWFWKVNNLNTLADISDFKGITRKINGGYNGLADREALYKKGLEVL